ncbi:DUF4097 domain-containing protein [Nonomuraea sp. NPDC050783]|uniref:DUF4097 family beta strand repeat-containing protein n=1 Tax=Nonomuraea sp. NPDC050783 TaxID=3154634 RepID=UPI003465B3AB
MPTFDTPTPISVRIDVPGGEIVIVASDRTDTVVDVRHDAGDEDAAIEVAYTDGELVIQATDLEQEHHSDPFGLSRYLGTAAITAMNPRGWGIDPRSWGIPGLSRMFGGGCDTTRVHIELPSGSQVRGEVISGDFRCSGRLGDCRLSTDYGDIVLETAAVVHLTSDSGEITVGRATGAAEITTSSGEVRVNAADGPAAIRNDDGEIYVGDAGGDLRLTGSHGDMYVKRARASVEATNVHGSVHLSEVVRGSVALSSTSGDLTVGIRRGTAAWLDAVTANGTLRNALDAQDTPDSFDETVEIHARTHDGDITVNRA